MFFPVDFSDLGKKTTILAELRRLVDKGLILKVARGIFLYPKIDDRLGPLTPTIHDIAESISKRDGARIVPTGDQALYLLGLSTQVPVRAVYLTDGSSRRISIGKRSIQFKHVDPKTVSTKGKIFPLFSQAVYAIGRENLKSDLEGNRYYFNSLRSFLLLDTMSNIRYNRRLVPEWVREYIDLLLNSSYEVGKS